MLLACVTSFLNVPTTDPDDARKRKLLNILLLGFTGITILVLVAAALSLVFGTEDQEGAALAGVGGVIMLIAMGILLVINRYWSGKVASWSFLIFYVAIIATTDTPEQLTNGRSLFVFSLPILVASVILGPSSSFVLAGMCSVAIALLSALGNTPFNGVAMAVFFAIALVSWLAARSLEQALRDLRLINQELDQRVADRTRELNDALKQVQTESSKNQAILESIADGVVVLEHDDQVMVANPAVVHLFGIPSEQIIGHRLGDLVGRTDSGGQQENLIQKFQAKDTQVSSFQFEREGKTLSVSLAPVAEIGEGGSGRVAVFRDFTREAELNRLKDLFFSMMTHELRTPLNAILGYTDMLRVGVYGEVNSEQDQTLGRIMANGKRMLNLVNNLLDQAQIKTGQLSLRIEPFSLRDLLNGLDSVMRVLADSKKIELEIHTEADMPSLLEGDPKRLEQILINLTGNAIKFTTEGKVTVRVYRHDSVYWAIAVSDTGPGIPPQYHDAIFESFKQVDDPITRQHVGTGLGLSIVKQLVTLSGGRITLSSEVGMGSTFTVILPFEPKKQTAQVAQTT